MSRILVDTSFLVALNNPRDRNYLRSRQFVADQQHQYLIPDVTLTEASYLLAKAGGIPLVLRFLDRLLITTPDLVALDVQNIQRAREIMANYIEAQFDFVDCCVMAQCERLGITQVCTFDYRDFAIFQPRHCAYLELLP